MHNWGMRIGIVKMKARIPLIIATLAKILVSLKVSKFFLAKSGFDLS